MVQRGGAAPARRDDRPGRTIGAERPEALRQLGRRAEPAVGEVAVDRGVAGGRDVAGDRVDRLDLAAVAGRRPRVEQDHGPEPGLQLLARDHAASTRSARWSDAGGQAGACRRQGSAGRRPGIDAAVEDGDLAMAEDVEHPPQPGRDPAADVVVGDDEVLVADPGRAEAVGERGGRGEGMAARRAEPVEVGEVVVQVEVDRARQVARRLRRRVRRPARRDTSGSRRSGRDRGRSTPAHAARRRRSAGFGSTRRAWAEDTRAGPPEGRSDRGPCYPVARRDAPRRAPASTGRGPSTLAPA